MRDDEQRASEAAKESLQPCETGEVQVVVGLIEQEQIRLGKQRSAEGEDVLFAAGQRTDELFAPPLKAKGIQHGDGPLRQAVAASLFEGFSRRFVGIERFADRALRRLSQALLPRTERPFRPHVVGKDALQHGRGLLILRLLGNIPKAERAGLGDHAAARRLIARDQP